MTEETKKPEEVILCQWEYDNYTGNPAESKNWVELSDADYGEKVTIFIGGKPQLVIDADRDQWGTWITFHIEDKGFTVAQEDGTKSFMDSLIASLNRLRWTTDCGTKPPVVTDHEHKDSVDEVLKEWYLAHKASAQNAKELIDSRSMSVEEQNRISDICGERMVRSGAADKKLFALRGEMPPLVRLYIDAEFDKGCNRCWISSCLPKDHPECEAKINRWFGYREALMAYIKPVYFRGQSHE